MRIVLVLIAGLGLTGCATLGLGGGGESDSLADFRSFVREDVGQALALASQATDTGASWRARCYKTLLEHIPAAKPERSTPEIKGLISGFEVAAETAAQIRERLDRGLIPEAVQADCGYLRGEIRRFLLRGGARFAPVPGLGSLGSGVLR